MMDENVDHSTNGILSLEKYSVLQTFIVVSNKIELFEIYEFFLGIILNILNISLIL